MKTTSKPLMRMWETQHHARGLIGSEFGITGRITLATPSHCVAAVTLASAVEMREWLAVWGLLLDDELLTDREAAYCYKVFLWLEVGNCALLDASHYRRELLYLE